MPRIEVKQIGSSNVYSVYFRHPKEFEEAIVLLSNGRKLITQILKIPAEWTNGRITANMAYFVTSEN